MEDIKNWNEFISDLSRNIFPVYRKHELGFDPWGIHGRLHISRALIFSEFIARFYYKELGIENIDFFAIRYAVAFHDSAREDNGEDLWESDSAELCYEYLTKKFKQYDSDYCREVSSLIIKDETWSGNKRIVHDGDVLEIMRPYCAPGGILGFRKKVLSFLSPEDGFVDHRIAKKHNNIREQLIQEAWKLIELTEAKKEKFDTKSNDHVNVILDLIKANKSEFKLLSWILR